MTEPTAPPQRPPHTRIGRRAGGLLGLVAAGVVGASLLDLVSVDSVVFRPGPVFDTLSMIDDAPIVQLDDEIETHPTEGHLYFTTIRLQGGPGDRLSAWDWIRARLDPSTSIVPREDVFPEDVSAEQVREQNTALMQHSQQDAAVVAFRAEGIEVPEDVIVAQVIVDAPADGVLHVDDQIVSVDGEEMDSAETVRERLQEVPAGESVPMTLVRDGEELTIDVPTTEDEGTGRTIVGVYLAPRYHLPVDVTIDAGNVGGPSAGLMFALAVYDQITPGPLTGGRSYAGTGAISSLGDVRPIGGIQQKMHAAQQAGADVFLAPQDNCGEVVGHEPDDLVVVPVDTFDDALDAIVATAAADDPADPALPTCEAVLEDAGG